MLERDKRDTLTAEKRIAMALESLAESHARGLAILEQMAAPVLRHVAEREQLEQTHAARSAASPVEGPKGPVVEGAPASAPVAAASAPAKVNG